MFAAFISLTFYTICRIRIQWIASGIHLQAVKPKGTKEVKGYLRKPMKLLPTGTCKRFLADVSYTLSMLIRIVKQTTFVTVT